MFIVIVPRTCFILLPGVLSPGQPHMFRLEAENEGGMLAAVNSVPKKTANFQRPTRRVNQFISNPLLINGCWYFDSNGC